MRINVRISTINKTQTIIFTFKGQNGSWYWRNAGSNNADVKVYTNSHDFEYIWGHQTQSSNPWECFFWNPEAVYGSKSWYATSCSRKRGFICQF